MMKKILNLFILLFVFFGLSSCSTNDNITNTEEIFGGNITIDANKVSSDFIEEEKLFEYNGHKFAYYNVCNRNGSFLIGQNGYIKSVNGKAGYSVRFFANDMIKLYSCDANSLIIEPKIEIVSERIIEEKHCYLLADCTNFIIINESATGVNIGTLYFWN